MLLFCSRSSDYLIASFGQTSATTLSAILDNAISHDKITRFLSKTDFTSKYLWLLVKETVRSVETEKAVLIFDDTVEEKKYTDENEIIAWHFDHSKNRSVKGVNILNCLYYSENVSIPVNFEVIKKDKLVTDAKTNKLKRKSSTTKNELMRNMLKTCRQNQLKYEYVLCDSWFASKDNMDFIKLVLEKSFIMAVKTNRTVALSFEDKQQGRFVKVSSLLFGANETLEVWIKGVSYPVLLSKQVFKNKDGSNGCLYLVSSDVDLTYDQITTIYQKRWKVEVFHKSIKSNASLAKSPTRTMRTQSNHFFASIYAFFKLEKLKIKKQINHFALKSKLYLSALKMSFKQLNLVNGA